jgi:tRNA U34 5-methylaminomethyl-2-thiouridine-forming methyltransferase MnmC
MERRIQLTADGSHTIAIPALDVTYHSLHGAIHESKHVFIAAALHYMLARNPGAPLSIFEMGFGTGLNALLTLQEAIDRQLDIYYQTVEQYPLTAAELAGLNFTDWLEAPALESYLTALHDSPWERDVPIQSCFTLHKSHNSLQLLSVDRAFDIIYYDAFAPRAQPELWTADIFRKLYYYLRPGGVLVTYCSKGNVKRAMQEAGFTVEHIPGPPRKREMLRATRPGDVSV